MGQKGQEEMRKKSRRARVEVEEIMVKQLHNDERYPKWTNSCMKDHSEGTRMPVCSACKGEPDHAGEKGGD